MCVCVIVFSWSYSFFTRTIDERIWQAAVVRLCGRARATPGCFLGMLGIAASFRIMEWFLLPNADRVSIVCLFVCFLVFFSAGSRRRGSFPRLQVMDVAKVTGHAGTGASGTLRAARNSSQLVACLRPIIFRIPRNVSISLQRNGSRSLASPSIEWVSVFIFRSIFHFSRFSFRFHRFKKGPHRLWWCGR